MKYLNSDTNHCIYENDRLIRSDKNHLQDYGFIKDVLTRIRINFLI